MPEDARTLGLAARALARHGLAHAYGHVSFRLNQATFIASPAQPLGTVQRGETGVVVEMDRPLPEAALPELRIHREIYRNRPQVGGICRFQSPAVIALSALRRTPRALHGLGTYFAPQPPLWHGTALVRDDVQAAAVAERLGGASAIVLRGNGAVVCAESLADATSLSFCLEDAARIELAALSAGRPDEIQTYSDEEVAARATRGGALFERMWQFLCFGDPEWQ
jgi:HCOMODA/2-hydroxy-3-carboxy-muconic semialdehyde decarboxylase